MADREWQFPQKLPHRPRIRRTAGYEVIVIRQYRPRLKLPNPFAGK